MIGGMDGFAARGFHVEPACFTESEIEALLRELDGAARFACTSMIPVPTTVPSE
jgi:hypothetical protein